VKILTTNTHSKSNFALPYCNLLRYPVYFTICFFYIRTITSSTHSYRWQYATL